jgi:hypothetical protein
VIGEKVLDVVVETEEIPFGFYGLFLVDINEFFCERSKKRKFCISAKARIGAPMANKPPNASTTF